MQVLLQLIPIAVDFVLGIVAKIMDGKMTKDEALDVLSFLVVDSDERREKLVAILDSPELTDSYRALDSALGPDPSE